MNDPQDLIEKAADVLGAQEGIIAAGIFGLKDNYVAAGAGTAAGGILAEAVIDNPLAGALGGGAGLHASRAARAAAKGVTVRMLVAVTRDRIRVLDWTTGSGPTKELLSFDRSCTEVTITKFGLSRHVELSEAASGRSLVLTGSTAPFASESKGDKRVLEEISTSR